VISPGNIYDVISCRIDKKPNESHSTRRRTTRSVTQVENGHHRRRYAVEMIMACDDEYDVDISDDDAEKIVTV
jgi:hypothetical protein